MMIVALAYITQVFTFLYERLYRQRPTASSADDIDESDRLLELLTTTRGSAADIDIEPSQRADNISKDKDMAGYGDGYQQPKPAQMGCGDGYQQPKPAQMGCGDGYQNPRPSMMGCGDGYQQSKPTPGVWRAPYFQQSPGSQAAANHRQQRYRPRGRGRGWSRPAEPPQHRPAELEETDINSYHNYLAFTEHQPATGSAHSTPQWTPLNAVDMKSGSNHLAFDELYELEQLWKQKQNRAAVTHFVKFLEHSATPYADFLRILVGCGDLKEMKTVTLSFMLAKEFSQWVATHDRSTEPLTEHLQQRAFEVATRNERNVFGPFLDNIVKGFKLRTVKHLAIPFCNKLIRDNGSLKDGAVLINALGLYSEFDIEKELIIPLLLDDKLNVAESLVKDSPEEQTKLVRFFDTISNRSFDLSSMIPPNIRNINTRLNHRTMLKHGTRLMKKYNTPSELCPNLAKSQGMAFVRYLLYRYYQHKLLAYENWAELTRGALSDDLSQQIEFVNLLASYDLPEAHRWYKDLQLPAGELHADIVDYEGGVDAQPSAVTEEEDWANDCIPIDYYELKLPADHLHMVASEEEFHSSVDSIIKAESGWVGIDCEWKPCFATAVSPRLAVLQLATWTDAYILDVIALQAIPHLDWSPLVDGIFMNADLLKIGYGFTSDLKLLRLAIPIWGSRNITNLLEMCNVQSAVCQAKGIVSSSSSEKGLSEAVRLFLGGQILDKQEQMSDWERRPLRRSQLTYAALDAFCLLELWKVLSKMADELNLYICAETYKKIPTTTSKKSKAKGKKKKVKSTPSGAEVFGDTSQLASQHTTQTIKFVVSNMLQGLGKQLRLLGVDVHIVDNDRGDYHDDAARLAHTEGRIILTAGQPFARLSAIAPPGKCFCVDTELSARQQALAIVKHFNITVTQGNIFSRCQNCNNDRYIIIDRFVMSEMCPRYTPRPPPLQDDWCRLHPSEDYDQSAIMLSNGIHIQLEPVSEKILGSVDAYFCCALCGKVFWEGSHYDRVQQNFAHILTLQTPIDQEPPKPVFRRPVPKPVFRRPV